MAPDNKASRFIEAPKPLPHDKVMVPQEMHFTFCVFTYFPQYFLFYFSQVSGPLPFKFPTYPVVTLRLCIPFVRLKNTTLVIFGYIQA